MDIYDLIGEPDATIWAKRWLEVIAEEPSIPTDESAMVGWFANALMSGYDRGRQHEQKRIIEEARTRKDQILELITNNPGINGIAVQKSLPNVHDSRQITYTLSDMRKEGLIENRGGRGRGAHWYIKENNA